MTSIHHLRPGRRQPGTGRTAAAADRRRWWSASADLLQEAADLPQPCYVTVYADQPADRPAVPRQAGQRRAITRWAHRFGSVVTSQPAPRRARPVTRPGTATFGYYGLTVTAYAHIPATPASI